MSVKERRARSGLSRERAHDPEVFRVAGVVCICFQIADTGYAGTEPVRTEEGVANGGLANERTWRWYIIEAGVPVYGTGYGVTGEAVDGAGT